MGKNSFLATAFLINFVYCGITPIFGEVFFKEDRAEILYGKGVHVFFDQNYKGAIDVLTQVNQLESADPRPYYFLALANYRLHQNDDADKYFKKAARLEQEGLLARDYNVSDALRRIQGRERLHIEKYRTQAKTDRQNAEKQKDEVLYSNKKAEENQILRTMAQQPVVVVPFGAKSIDPFGTGNKIEVPMTPADAVRSKPKEENKETVSTDTEKDDTAKKTEEKSDDDDSSDDKEMKADDTKESEEKKDDNDPFATSDDKEMKADDTKESEEKKDDDDPFK